ncbi:conjugation system SOS inhibitor PsiB family protein (plasmid) [Edwardsiella tarda]|uniref:conjugation system SOS inhibitor PsiB family protein n=1 Tax=Edwardsiella tarda TaxID=636 RepID=UPI00244385E1|nr:conjugation system SOS inhibitor PsiB family protein [Edwardsiella tarda]WGE31042.1 conjugation system SOS inhibitor PsiB family protein [Edwardsiella tarda]
MRNIITLDVLKTMIPVSASGRPFAVVRTLLAYSPEVINHTLGLIARLDAEGYSHNAIINLLAMEGEL